METYQERSYGVHVINKSIGTGYIWNKKKNKKKIYNEEFDPGSG